MNLLILLYLMVILCETDGGGDKSNGVGDESEDDDDKSDSDSDESDDDGDESDYGGDESDESDGDESDGGGDESDGDGDGSDGGGDEIDNEWASCIPPREYEEYVVTSQTMQNCSLASVSVEAPLYFCGDSLLTNFTIVVQNQIRLSNLSVFYDEYQISFELYLDDSLTNINVLFLSSIENYASSISFDVVDKSSIKVTIGEKWSKEFKLVPNTWNSIELKQFFNGSYFHVIRINGSVVFDISNTEPKVDFNMAVEIPFQNKSFLLKNIFIVSKTQVFWTQWNNWSKCNAALTTRTRCCKSNQWINCSGNITDISSCVSSHEIMSTTSTDFLLQVSATVLSNIINREWATWSECSATCGNGFQIQRSLDVINNLTMTKTCNLINCPVDGMWGNWRNSECSSTCGGSAKVYFNRSCSNPSPAYNGRMCMGNYNYTKDCQDDIICPVNGNWSNWSAWSICSQPCEGGIMSRFRSCSMPKYGGQHCHGNSTETISCQRRFCKKADLSVGIYLPNIGYQTYYSNPEHPGSGELMVDIEKAITNFYKSSKKNVTLKIKLNYLIKGNP